VITPRTTRLVRVADLHLFRNAIDALAAAGSDPASSTLVIVPTRGAARQLSQRSASAGLRSARCLTRDDFYDELRTRLSNPPRRLLEFDRRSLMHASAEANARLLPFRLRPGVVAAMLRFYDEIRRQSQSVARFEELLAESLGGGDEDTDRGTQRLRRQTTFLAASFREYEKRIGGLAASDEHTLRARLLSETLSPPVERVVVTVADWIAEPAGLFVADFDFLSRLPRLQSIDIVCTERVLESGFHERLHGWWPGLDEIDGLDVAGRRATIRPRLVTPPDGNAGQLWFTYRDREEELLAIARRIVTNGTSGSRPAIERTGVVFKRPLPYLYLAPDAFNTVGLAFQSPDALPLATEPTAAALDLVLECAESGFTRPALTAILRSPHFRLAGFAEQPSRDSVAALDRSLSDLRYLGDPARLEALAGPDSSAPLNPAARPALEAAIVIARELAPLLDAAPASTQIRRLAGFFRRHLSEELSDREKRARALVDEILDGLAAAHAAHHDPDWTITDLAPAVREWIGEQTFAAVPSSAGVQLLDDQAARYGEFDDMVLVGLIESEWPERPRRNIFYAAAALKALGWPSERDRRSGADARFLDLLESAASTVRLSTFTLEDEALVVGSSQLDEIPRARLSSIASDEIDDPYVFPDETLTADPPRIAGFDRSAAEWLEMRTSRTPASDPRFHGVVGPLPPRAWSVSALETYLECPFKFFARHVLRLREEPDHEETMDPRRQGQFVHQVFEEFFKEWQASGQRTITSTNLDAARGMFTAVVDRLLVNVPVAEAALERTRLLGSPAAAGLGEAVLRMEAERSVAVEERLLEHDLSGTFRIQSEAGERAVALRGKADRLDLLTDGTFRLIDYKLGWPPSRARALQLPVYGLCAEQQLAGRGGKAWKLREAVYLAFKGPRRVVPLFTTPSDRDEVLSAAQVRLTAAIDAIGRGEYPPTPDDVFRCETCDFAAVCRKDYVGDV
jgi:RecB family exonuclease